MSERPQHKRRPPPGGTRRGRKRARVCPTALLCLAGFLWMIAPSAVAEQAHAPDPASTSAHAAAHESSAPAAGHGESHPELPNIVTLLYRAREDTAAGVPPWLAFVHRFQDVFFAWLAVSVIIVLVRLATRRMGAVPGRLQAAVESFVGGFRGFVVGILGPSGERYVPFLGSLFLYIWFMNLFGLVPLMKSPTAALSTTVALAVCVFLYVQGTGLRRLGLIGYVRHLAGDPRDAVGWALVPLMLPLHIISEFAKPVSLSLRLFGNILGEDVLLGIFAGLGVAALAFFHLPFGLPLHLPFILLALLMSTVQALVFTLLSTIYIMQVLPHDADEPPVRAAAARLPAGESSVRPVGLESGGAGSG